MIDTDKIMFCEEFKNKFPCQVKVIIDIAKDVNVLNAQVLTSADFFGYIVMFLISGFENPIKIPLNCNKEIAFVDIKELFSLASKKLRDDKNNRFKAIEDYAANMDIEICRLIREKKIAIKQRDSANAQIKSIMTASVLKRIAFAFTGKI